MIFFQNKTMNKTDDKSKDGALWSILCSILPYMLRFKKQNNERYRAIQSIFLKINLSFCVDIILSHDACTELLPIYIF